MKSEDNTPLEHQDVPVAHQGLHNFLYSSDNEHNANVIKTQLKFDGTAIIKTSEWLNQAENTKVSGVYAVLNSDRIYQYIGYSRDVLRSVKGHITQNGEDVCTFIRIKTFKFPKRQAMETLKTEWIAELGYTPLGNTNEGNTWARTIGETAKVTMTEAEKNAYEDKKLKLRKAMADATLIDELTTENSPSEVQRRQQLEAAVQNDDWSSVIDSQT